MRQGHFTGERDFIGKRAGGCSSAPHSADTGNGGLTPPCLVTPPPQAEVAQWKRTAHGLDTAYGLLDQPLR